MCNRVILNNRIFFLMILGVSLRSGASREAPTSLSQPSQPLAHHSFLPVVWERKKEECGMGEDSVVV